MKQKLHSNLLPDKTGSRHVKEANPEHGCLHAGLVRLDGSMQFISVIRRKKNNLVSIKLVLRTHASE